MERNLLAPGVTDLFPSHVIWPISVPKSHLSRSQEDLPETKKNTLN